MQSYLKDKSGVEKEVPEGMPTAWEGLGYLVGMIFLFPLPCVMVGLYGENKDMIAEHRILGLFIVLSLVLISATSGLTVVILVNRRQHRRERIE